MPPKAHKGKDPASLFVVRALGLGGTLRNPSSRDPFVIVAHAARRKLESLLVLMLKCRSLIKTPWGYNPEVVGFI